MKSILMSYITNFVNSDKNVYIIYINNNIYNVLYILKNTLTNTFTRLDSFRIELRWSGFPLSKSRGIVFRFIIRIMRKCIRDVQRMLKRGFNFTHVCSLFLIYSFKLKSYKRCIHSVCKIFEILLQFFTKEIFKI